MLQPYYQLARFPDSGHSLQAIAMNSWVNDVWANMKAEWVVPSGLWGLLSAFALFYVRALTETSVGCIMPNALLPWKDNFLPS